MSDYDPSAPPDYNSMQQQMGLIPPIFQPPPIPFPGQVSAAMAQGGVGGAFMTAGSAGTSFGAGAFPAQQLQTFTNQGPMLQGPTGIMMPMAPGAAFNPYAAPNPYANLGARGPYGGAPGMFTPNAPSMPLPYAGQLSHIALAPPPPASQFNTSYMADIERRQLTEDNTYGRAWAGAGIGARIATDFTGGFAGAMLGRKMGVAGGIIGGFAGFLGAEMSGLGQFGQNSFMNSIASPFLQQRATAGGLEEMSRSFVNSGSALNSSGMGFSHHAASQAAGGLRDLASSSQFQRETGDRFNMQDLMKVAQDASRNDMMSGVQNSGQLTNRVRDIAKSLSSFMELAQEPDIQRAIQTMGQLRASGLNLSETNQAVSNGRTFARMAGTSFSEISAQAGAMGSQTAASMGLTQGLGLQTGMANYALARGSQNGGLFGPQMMNLVGGAHGLANMNNMFSNSMLQTPMLAPSVMSSSGGINLQALQGLLSGQTNSFGQTSSATAALQAMTNRQGISGLGTAIAMQPLIQDTIGRALQGQGPFGQRNFDDTQIMNNMRQMGLRGSSGYMTMAQTMGADRTQALARVRELGSEGYMERQRTQIETMRSDERQTELERREESAPGFFGLMATSADFDAGRSYRNLGRSMRAMVGMDTHSHYSATTDEERERDRALLGSTEFAAYGRNIERAARGSGETGTLGGLRDRFQVARGEGYTGWMAAMNMVDYRDPAQLAHQMQNLQEGSRISGLMSATSRGETDSGVAGLNKAFGADRAFALQQGLSSRLVSRLGADNMGMSASQRAAFNAGSGLAVTAAGFIANPLAGVGLMAGEVTGATSGEVTHRQITGEEYRAMYLQSAADAGISNVDADREYQRDPTAAWGAQGRNARLRMNRAEEAALFADAEQSQGLGARGGQTDALHHAADEARTNLFGNTATDFQEQFEGMMGGIRGNEKERSYIGTHAMLSRRLLELPSDSPEKARINLQLDNLQRQARANGVNVNSETIMNQIAGARDRMPTQDMSQAFAEAHPSAIGDLMGGVESGNNAFAMNRAQGRMVSGAQSLSTGDGRLAARLRREAGGGSDTNLNLTRVRDILRNASDEDLQQAHFGQGDIDSLRSGEVNSVLSREADRGELLKRRYKETVNVFERGINAAFGYDEESYVRENRATTTEADAVAERRRAGLSPLDQARRALGIGGSTDPMTEAASELRIAAQALSRVAGNGSLDDMLNPP
jgi:hypothetical protein